MISVTSQRQRNSQKTTFCPYISLYTVLASASVLTPCRLQLAIASNKKALVAVYLQFLDLLVKAQVLKSERY